jgi:hypothetical protein
MVLVPLFDLKFLIELAASGVGLQIGGTSQASFVPLKRCACNTAVVSRTIAMA